MKRERRGKGGWKINSRNKKDQTKIQTRETKTIETQAMLNRNDAGLRGGRDLGGEKGAETERKRKHVFVGEGIKTIFKTTFIHL